VKDAGLLKAYIARDRLFCMDDSIAGDSRPGIGEYLIQRIYEAGARHVFGVPGDYILNFYAMLCRSPLQVINTCDEQGAGFAADAYARVHGLGVVCVTYNVGGFKVVNTTAEAYAEKSPVLVIAGAPGWQERKKFALLHHKVREYNDQYEMFRRITVASTELHDPEHAYEEIDRVLAEILCNKGPGYIELPRDIVNVVPGCRPNIGPVPSGGKSKGKIPPEVLDQVVLRVNGSSSPVIIAGEEIARNHLGSCVQELAEQACIPIVSTMLGKSAIDETSSRYLGVYAGVIEDEKVREYVEASDCLLVLGVIFNDVNLGGNTAVLDPDRMIVLSGDSCKIGTLSYSGPGLDALPDLCRRQFTPHDFSRVPPAQKDRKVPFIPEKSRITAERLFIALNSFVDEKTVVIADVGDAAMGSMSIAIPRPFHFLCPIYYSSLGFSVPASIGVKAARPDLRPLVIVGDGAFQMTGMEISTAARHDMDPIVIVLNNGGFGTERPMIDGSFNDVASWKYHLIPDVIGKGKGCLVKTEDELGRALSGAKESKDLSIIEVILDPNDITPQLRRMCQRLAKGVKK
jgi:TPP-dependent 2-oxoacid decarboxylase